MNELTAKTTETAETAELAERDAFERKMQDALELGTIPEFDPELYPALYDALNGTANGGFPAGNTPADLETEEGIREALEALQHDLSL